MPLAPSIVFIYKKEEIVPNLTKLIIDNMHTERWLFKIDNEHNGRGIAYFDVNSSSALLDIKKNLVNLDEKEIYIEIQGI